MSGMNLFDPFEEEDEKIEMEEIRTMEDDLLDMFGITEVDLWLLMDDPDEDI